MLKSNLALDTALTKNSEAHSHLLDYLLLVRETLTSTPSADQVWHGHLRPDRAGHQGDPGGPGWPHWWHIGDLQRPLHSQWS